jgi:hypothetical protein
MNEENMMNVNFKGAMRNIFTIAIVLTAATMFGGCTSALYSNYNNDDLYATHDREAIAKAEADARTARYEAMQAEAEARRAEYEALVAIAEAAKAENKYKEITNPNDLDYTSVVADTYESAYARRLRGFDSPYYNMPSSYYNLRYSGSYAFLSAYDPAFYNIIVMGDQVWVEPKYITSMFGSWGATNVTFGLYASPWTYGWNYHVDPFYYSMWGYPRYSWYDWNWNICYNPYYYDWYWSGYYDPYYYHHHHHHYPGHHHTPAPPAHRPGHNHGHKPDNNRPDYRPGGITGSGASSGPGNLNGNRVSTGNRYTSPTSNRNYGSSDNRVNIRPNNGGSTSQGFNGTSVNTNTSTTNRNNGYVVSDTRIDGTSSNLNSGVGSSKNNNSNFRPGTINNGNSTRNNGTTTGTSTNIQSNKTTGSSSSGNSNFRQGSSSSSTRGTQTSGGTVTTTNRGTSTSSGSSYRSNSSGSRTGSSSSNYRSGSSSSSSRSSSSSSSSNYRSGSSSSSSSRSSYSGSSSSRSSSSSSSGSFRSGSSSGSSRR